MRSVCDGAFAISQMLGRLRANLHLCVFSGAFDIVRDRHAGLEFIARRRQRRHARRDDERSANERIPFPPRRSHRRATATAMTVSVPLK